MKLAHDIPFPVLADYLDEHNPSKGRDLRRLLKGSHAIVYLTGEALGAGGQTIQGQVEVAYGSYIFYSRSLEPVWPVIPSDPTEPWGGHWPMAQAWSLPRVEVAVHEGGPELVLDIGAIPTTVNYQIMLAFTYCKDGREIASFIRNHFLEAADGLARQ